MSDGSNINSVVGKSIVSTLVDGLQSSQKLNLTSSQKKLDSLPSLVDEETLTELKNGGYGITLRDYTKLSTYKNSMSVLYGENSANRFTNYLNKLYGLEDDTKTQIDAKTFMDKLRDKGISNKTALKMYTAIQKYTTTDSMINNNMVNNNNFVNAKI